MCDHAELDLFYRGERHVGREGGEPHRWLLVIEAVVCRECEARFGMPAGDADGDGLRPVSLDLSIPLVPPARLALLALEAQARE